jgi:hypothetical protein
MDLTGFIETLVIIGVLMIFGVAFVRWLFGKKTGKVRTVNADEPTRRAPTHSIPRADIKAGIHQERRLALLKMEQQYYQNLNNLEERAAQYGLNIPLEIANQIRYFKEKIAEVEAELADLSNR